MDIVPETNAVRPVHTAVKGRARFKVRGLQRCPALRNHLTAGLARQEAVFGVSASTVTGSVVVEYNSGNDFNSIANLIESLVMEYRGDDTAPVSSPARKTQEQPGPPAVKTPQAISVPAKKLYWAREGRKEQEEAPWHTMPCESVLQRLRSSAASGLSGKEIEERLGEYGPNALPESSTRSGWSILAGQFTSLPVALLGVAAGVSVLTGGIADAVVILGVVAINGVIGYVTESEAERTINSLKDLVKPTADVLRDDSIKTVMAEEVAPGDILVLRPGAYVAADARLLEADHLSLDESVLTGESMPATKSVAPLGSADIPLADRANMVYMGTLVTGGQGLAVVTATGSYTEVGRLQVLVGEASSPETPMERQLNRLGDQLVVISGAACGLVFGIGILRGYGFMMMLKTAISLAVAAVPEGLPAVATTTLALGIRNMKKHHVLIRHLDAIETLGCIQTICFDKTGTITQNRMAVVRLFAGMKEMRPGEFSFASDSFAVPVEYEGIVRMIQASVLCNEAEVFEDHEKFAPGPDMEYQRLETGAPDSGRSGREFTLRGSPTEIALINLALQSGIDVVGLRRRYRLLKINYRSESRLYMGSLHEFHEDGRRRMMIAMKGSPEEVLAMCDRHMDGGVELPLTDDDRSRIELENERMAGDALRVLGIAYALVDSEADFGATNGFVWLGLIGMADPVRPGVAALIEEFHRAGIDTVMITGDQSATAYAIGKELELSRGEPLEILDSTVLTRMDPEALKALSDKVHVFARVSPAFKLEIVRALQSKNRVVAMTGDGINDGPALKAADIGIAMGEGGTDIAREVADMVLEEDNLETVIVAVRDGRTIHNNIRKSLRFLLSTNFSEIMVMLFTVGAGLPSPMSAMQLLWINLISDIFPGLALAMEAPEPNVLEQPPRSPDEPIVKTADFKRLALESSVLSLSAMASYGYGVMRYGMGAQAGTLAFQSLTMGQLLHSISCRSETHSIFSEEKLPPNRYLNIALGGSLALQALTIFVPGLRGLLGLAPIGLADGAIIAGTAALPLLINEATKHVGSERQI